MKLDDFLSYNQERLYVHNAQEICVEISMMIAKLQEVRGMMAKSSQEYEPVHDAVENIINNLLDLMCRLWVVATANEERLKDGKEEGKEEA